MIATRDRMAKNFTDFKHIRSSNRYSNVQNYCSCITTHSTSSQPKRGIEIIKHNNDQMEWHPSYWNYSRLRMASEYLVLEKPLSEKGDNRLISCSVRPYLGVLSPISRFVNTFIIFYRDMKIWRFLFMWIQVSLVSPLEYTLVLHVCLQ